MYTHIHIMCGNVNWLSLLCFMIQLSFEPSVYVAATWPNLKKVRSLPEMSVIHEQSCCLRVYSIVVVIYMVQSISSRTEFFALVRSVVTTPAARGIIPKVPWASVLKASFLYASCVMQLQLLSRGAVFSLRLSRWRISVNNTLASNSVSSQGKLLQNVMKC